MEAKSKSGAPTPKAASKAEKKEAPKKAPEPAPATPEPEVAPPQDGAAEAEAAGEASGTDSFEQLKPYLIGGAIITAGAILLGVLLMARRK
ncbi:hypothetical protein NQD34_002047 [Periophthalmus magnuspinnatus]|nr:hypothetical protein NQD34_002047 [Periophthalmus magnuspinnatus]